jgi:hypothetical protein
MNSDSSCNPKPLIGHTKSSKPNDNKFHQPNPYNIHMNRIRKIAIAALFISIFGYAAACAKQSIDSWLANIYIAEMPKEIEVNKTVYLPWTLALPDFCGAAIFKITKKSAEEFASKNNKILNSTPYARKQKGTNNYLPWSKTPLTGRALGYDCHSYPEEIKKIITENSNEPNSFYTKKTDTANRGIDLLVSPEKELIIITYHDQ